MKPAILGLLFCIIVFVTAVTLRSAPTEHVEMLPVTNNNNGEAATMNVAKTTSSAAVDDRAPQVPPTSSPRSTSHFRKEPGKQRSATSTTVADGCDFTTSGKWVVRPAKQAPVSIGNSGGNGNEAEKQLAMEIQQRQGGYDTDNYDAKWFPSNPSVRGCDPHNPEQVRTFKQFTQNEALQCLSGKTIVLYGNSNTRSLYTALEAQLKGTKQVSRLAAKQLCDNSKRNHSCWITVEEKTLPTAAPSGGGGGGGGGVKPDPFDPIRVVYLSYIDDLFHPSLKQKLQPYFGTADIIVGNTGVNVIATTKTNEVFEKSHRASGPKLNSEIVDKMTKPGARFIWHTTSPLCSHQKHFKRYKYQKKFWAGRSLEDTNSAVLRSNEIAMSTLRSEGAVINAAVTAAGKNGNGLTVDGRNYKMKKSVFVIDDFQLMKNKAGATFMERVEGDDDVKNDGTDGALAKPFEMCELYEDPLHHRFLDKQVVQLMLNYYCKEDM